MFQLKEIVVNSIKKRMSKNFKGIRSYVTIFREEAVNAERFEGYLSNFRHGEES